MMDAAKENYILVIYFNYLTLLIFFHPKKDIKKIFLNVNYLII